eukprot:scaffold62830_cov33-Phaeocystis_antarctica.AAC.1
MGGSPCRCLIRCIYTPKYGGRSRRTRLFEDQLGRADAGSWQIADRYYMASSAARVVAIGDFRVRFVPTGLTRFSA